MSENLRLDESTAYSAQLPTHHHPPYTVYGTFLQFPELARASVELPGDGSEVVLNFTGLPRSASNVFCCCSSKLVVHGMGIIMISAESPGFESVPLEHPNHTRFQNEQGPTVGA